MRKSDSLIFKYDLNDNVTLKKGHACGENSWVILRKGADIKLECKGCGRQIWMSRLDFDKRVRKIYDEDAGKFVSIVHYRQDEED